MAQAIVVLMTPDDEARLQKYFIKEDDPIHERELTPQPKQNVLFEAGMAMGRSENRTILVELGNLRPFSDVYGRHVIRLDNSPEKRKELAQRIQNVGCPVDLSGNHWFTAGGDFNQIIKDFETKQTVDEIELRILKITKKEPSITTNRVADELGIKVSELMTRLNRLEKSGLIRVVMHPEVNDTFGGLYITIKGIEELNRYIKAE